jgi:hypothetical protein
MATSRSPVAGRRWREWSQSFFVSVSLVTLLCVTNLLLSDPELCLLQRELDSPWSSLQGQQFATALSSAAEEKLQADANAVVLAQSSTGNETTRKSDEMEISTIIEQAAASAATAAAAVASAVASLTPAPEDLVKLDELRVLLGCKGNDWSICLKAASKVASQRAIDEVAATELRVPRTDNAYTNINLIDHHPALALLKPEYRPAPEWTKQNILPDISIIGLAKAGTSQLYHIWTHHAAATPFNAGTKEYCMRLPAPLMDPGSWANDDRRLQLQKGLYDWHRNLYAQSIQRQSANKKKTINGCLSEHEVWLSVHYLNATVRGVPNPVDGNTKQQPKYILLLRDPADLLWGIWNYWVDMGLDTKLDTPGSWATRDLHYRSPELFHELVLSAHKTKGGDRLVNGLRRQSVTNGRRLVALVGRDNVLFLRNEDMLPAVVEQPGGLLDRLSNFSGLDRTRFGDDGLRTIRNCNDVKGEKSKCGNITTSAYEITGHREMLESTRSLIYLHFQEECHIWEKEFGVTYPDCLNAATIQRE